MAKGQSKSKSVSIDTAQPSEQMALSSALSSPWAFLRPTNDLHTTVVDSAKHILDSLAGSVVDAQTTRRQLNKKRKRSALESDSVTQLQLKNLYVDGFTSNQIWEQATRILESTGDEIERDITLISQHGGYMESADSEQLEDMSDPEGAQSDSDSQEGMLEEFSEGSGAEDDLDDESDQEIDMGSDEDMEGMEDIEDMDDDNSSVGSAEGEPEEFVEDKFGLNDGFFSIDDFNKQSEALERQDAAGGPEQTEDSDEEDLDWHSNPLIAGNAATIRSGDKSKSSRPTDKEDEDMDDSEEEGPTFGNADLNGDSDSDDEDVADMDDGEAAAWVNTSDIKYADFFAPPPRKASNKKHRALPKTQPDAPAVDENDVKRAMDDVRRDLFDDGDADSAEEDEMELDESADPTAPRSTHEKQRARIADEIRRLESANVAKKEWMYTGEARAVERPINSLIEEDLEFERIGKPVPVNTNETTEDIEELIKRRILAMEFDEVIRRRPGAEGQQAGRKPRFELSDTKAEQGLAEMYETDHLRANDPNFVDTKDRKLMREHAEITSLWNELSSQLDTLCNWHYKPKVAQASINVVTDAPTIMMEEARPTAGGAAGGPVGLAPQEIYAPGDGGRVKGEVILKTGASISKEEMTREQKAKNRRQNKQTQKKADAAKPAEQKNGKAAEKQQMISDLKKGGVKVIDKEGRMTNIDGGSVHEGAKHRGDNLKL
ncbi:U3 small nucleolar ribonucleoprotein complex, subunit Mpp10p [Penicillium griseofulvum]|uniref:U3 small nucleolar ribonucleoprotein protein MPP10 n=1 Tax=Penicillium patulum TaxID=5078 RepID=A0A135LTN0_PENPA|nr:U3 small nucleolar ribonucleoprotein complex, subunit Mpp10p [Penicillium griseofulvum]KXG52338.1 U3 small nucleolar ribonucleoprotein complex, subunit Mpp10p [Penicillium griseofulvum]